MGALKTLHVVGFKNSGKTTLISKWVRLLKQQGISVAVLKHHGHSSPLDMPDSETDSMRFFNSGADVSTVAGGGVVQLYMNEEPDFIRMKEIATLTNPDILLVEGYKEEQGMKVVLLRNENDWEELQSLADIALVIGSEEIEFNISTIISRADNDQLNHWLLNWIKEGNEDETF